MRDFPLDVLLRIFTVATMAPDLPTLDPHHPIRTVARVCRSWNQITQRNPCLWANILVDLGHEISEQQKNADLHLLRFHLLQSKGAPLSIICVSCPLLQDIAEDEYSAYEAAQLIRAHAHHVRSLKVPLPLLAVILGPAQFPIHSRGDYPHLPMLEHISTAVNEAEYDEEIQDCIENTSGRLVVAPALAAAARLSVFHGNFDLHLIALPWSHITHLSINISAPSSLARFLPLLTALQVLRVRYVRYIQREALQDPHGLQDSDLVFPSTLVRLELQLYREQYPGGGEATTPGPMFSDSVFDRLRELVVCPPYWDDDPDNEGDNEAHDSIDIQWDADAFGRLISRSPMSFLTMICLRRVSANWEDLRGWLTGAQGLTHLELWASTSGSAPGGGSGFAPIIPDLAAQGRDLLFPVLERLVLVDIPDAEIDEVVDMVVRRSEISPLQEFGYTPVEELDDSMVATLTDSVGPLIKDMASRVNYVFAAI